MRKPYPPLHFLDGTCMPDECFIEAEPVYGKGELERIESTFIADLHYAGDRLFEESSGVVYRNAVYEPVGEITYRVSFAVLPCCKSDAPCIVWAQNGFHDWGDDAYQPVFRCGRCGVPGSDACPLRAERDKLLSDLQKLPELIYELWAPAYYVDEELAEGSIESTSFEREFCGYTDSDTIAYGLYDAEQGESLRIYGTHKAYSQSAKSDMGIEVPRDVAKRQDEMTENVSKNRNERREWADRSSKAECFASGSTRHDWVVRALDEAGIAFVDKRPHGGSLWVAGGMELKTFMDSLAVRGAYFNYSLGGGKAIGYVSGWWMPGYPKEIRANA